jgi:ribonuclease HI
MKAGDVFIIRPTVHHATDHFKTEGTHLVEVLVVDPSDSEHVFMNCRDHGNNAWAMTNEFTIEGQELDTTPFHLIFANFDKKNDTEVYLNVVTQRDTNAESAQVLLEQYTHIPSAYLIVKNMTTNEIMIWDRTAKETVVVTKQVMLNTKTFLVAFTGHRPDKLGRGAYDMNAPIRRWIRKRIKETLLELLTIYPDLECIVGGAIGVDTDAVLVCQELGIPYHLFAPCHNQDKKWPAASQAMYREHWNGAKSRRYIHDGPYPGAWCMQRRNEEMVKFADLLISVWNGSSGGTQNCRVYAEKVGKPIFNIDPRSADLTNLPTGAMLYNAPAATTTPIDPNAKFEAIAYFDGACRGNPGPATSGYVIEHDDKLLDEQGAKLGTATNNIAEWKACIAALQGAVRLGVTHLTVRGDSQLVIKQMTGEYRVKDANLIPLYNQALELATHFRACKFVWIPREQNPADATANAAF